jgi:amino acid adenylation domain-containing protein
MCEMDIPGKHDSDRQVTGNQSGPRAGKQTGRPTEGRISARPDMDRIPLSFGQQRFWILDQMGPGNPAYHVSFSVRVHGRLDQVTVEKSICVIIERHEILRTLYKSEGGHPCQVILQKPSLDMELVDLRNSFKHPDENTARQAVKDLFREPFDLSCDPVCRVKIFRINEQNHVISFVVHHISADAWSVGLLFSELNTIYTALDHSKPVQLGPLPIQYADYACWQREYLTSPACLKQLEYWKAQLSGELPVLALPTDFRRPAERQHRGEQVSRNVPDKLLDRLTKLCGQLGVSLFIVLAAAVKILLFRYTNQVDILLGAAVSGRNRKELDHLAGFFVNTLVIRSYPEKGMSLRDFLAQVRETVLQAFEHQEVPFDKIVEDVHPDRNISRTPLFQAIMTLQNVPLPGSGGDGDTVFSPFSVEREFTAFDLEFQFIQNRRSLTSQLVFRADLFRKSTMERMLRHLDMILTALVHDLDQSLQAIKLISQPETSRAISEWNGQRTEPPDVRPVHSLFECQVELRDSSPALAFGSDLYTYGELNVQSNRMAHNLLDRGVKPGEPVGLYMHRGSELIVSMLAVLKAGGVCLPLDPSYPLKRLRFMLRDSGSGLLLSNRGMAGPLLDGEENLKDIVVVETGSSEGNLTGFDAGNPDVETNSRDLAFIFYTSGSTGLPRGACIEHRSITRLVLDTNYIQLGVDDCIAQASNCSFDAATFEIWGALLNGCRLVGLDQEDVLDPDRLVNRIRENGVNVIFLTTALFNQVSRCRPDAFKEIRYVLFGGERVDVESVSRVLEAGRPQHLLHMYGPTESTTFATYYEITDVSKQAETIPIGRPVSNSTIYVLDERMQLVPPGVPGELYLGGDGLARCYLNREKLTEERFVDDPFSGIKNSRLYRTGDLVRYLEDGAIEYLGRNDNQVKIRGFRIEPGEIETLLPLHPSVGEAVVVVREDEPGEHYLAAYVVPLDGVAPDVESLKTHLRVQLPEYMIPLSWVMLKSLPLNANGKIHREALPRPEHGQRMTREEYIAPRNETEETIARIWCDLLGLDRVGIHDNFFDLGGHSLLATQVISRIREIFAADVTLTTIFRKPVIAELGIEVAGLTRGLSEPDLVIPIADRGGIIPVSFAQHRMLFLDRYDAGSATYVIPGAVHLEGELDTAVLESSLQDLVNRHESLRTVFAEVDGQPAQIIHKDDTLYFEQVNHDVGYSRGVSEASRELIRKHSLLPFNLSEGPLLRVTLIRISPTEHILMFMMHHIIADGWSIGIFISELAENYNARLKGETPDLPLLTVQYADFAVWQRQWLAGERMQQQLDYWKGHLGGNLPVLEIPGQATHPRAQTFEGAHCLLEVEEVTTGDLHEFCREHDVTPFMVLLTAFSTVIHRYSGQEDIVIASPVANRNRIELEGIIGLFVNTLPLRTRFDDDPSLEVMLKRVRETSLGGLANQDVPFELLVDELIGERDKSRNPIFQVMFTLQSDLTADSLFGGCRVRNVPIDTHTAKFEMSLSMTELKDAIGGVWEFNTALFSREMVGMMIKSFQQVLKALIFNPDQGIREIDLMTEADRRQVLNAWTGTGTEYPRDSSVVELFEDVVRVHGEQIALTSDGAILLYRELNDNANRIAHYLIGRGVTPGNHVAISMERSPLQVTAILGILKTGAVYIPVDPEYPARRREYLIKDTSASLLLTETPLLDKFHAVSADIICLDRQWAEIKKCAKKNPHVRVSATDLAYIMYTSGSTGTPKGTCIEHRSIVRLVRNTHYLDFGPNETFMLLAPVSFDASTLEIWGSLLNGSRLVVYRPGPTSLEELGAAIRREKISVLWLTATLFHQMVDHQLENLGVVKQLVAGGNVLSVSHVRRVLSGLKEGHRLVNGYGPTENTTFTCCHVMTRDSELGASVPIGLPISNTRVYVLDDQGHLLPPGICGELYIGGDGLSRGYLNQEALTEDKFVQNPLDGTPDERLYRSGDLVRYRHDGVIEFVGRVDDQVKIRGFRIEPGEIEHVLVDECGVEQAVVGVRENKAGDKKLIAWYVDGHDRGGGETALREKLKIFLPEHMVPFSIIRLEELPLTANSKVDREALPEPEYDRDNQTVGFVEPQTGTEITLARIWREILELEEVGIHDNFFELGGHSLLATQVISRVQVECSMKIDMLLIFGNQTVHSLATAIDQLVDVSPLGGDRDQGVL